MYQSPHVDTYCNFHDDMNHYEHFSTYYVVYFLRLYVLSAFKLLNYII